MRWIFLFLLSWFTVLVVLSCNEFQRNKSHQHVPLSSIRKGKQLAAQYCGSCHLVPDPAMLDSRSWAEGVLPQMGPRLGIFAYEFQRYPSAKGDTSLPQGFYPDKQQISFIEWQHIIDYYTATSPDTLIVERRTIPKNLALFEVQAPVYRSSFPMVSFIGIEEQKKTLTMFDLTLQKLLFFDAGLRVKDSLSVEGAISDVQYRDSSLLWLNMGNINPNNTKLGSLQTLKGKNQLPTSLVQQLQRPVVLQQADFNKDGAVDFVIGSFGFMTGHLSWYEAGKEGRYKQHLIKPLAGAAQVYVTDDNSDGLPDLWVLFAQGDESIRRFINKGGGAFEEQIVLRFPPVYGSTYFELVDMDGDGDKDIVYTCGDNADYSKLLKPYHGVYVYLQEGALVFKQRYFYPMNGAFKTQTLDFDSDGDQDIAAVSFFADYSRTPEEGFVFLEHNGHLAFRAATVPEAASGRWITLDAGDLDGDGRPDLVLGNLAKGPMVVPSMVNWQEGPLFLFLKNKSVVRKP